MRLSTPVLGSREDPPATLCRAAARLPSGPASLRRLDTQMASFHLQHRLGDLRESDGGTVGLDPSRACVRTSLFTKSDHGWPPLPMTRPKSLSGAEVCTVSFRRDGFSRSIASSPGSGPRLPEDCFLTRGSRSTSVGFLTSKIARK